jgi:hypothetical protein
VGVTALDPALEDSIRRYEGALIRLHDVLDGLGDAAARRAPARGWSVAQCLDHLVVAGSLTAAQLERTIQRARELTQVARSDRPARLGWLDRLAVALLSRGKSGARPRLPLRHPQPFDPGAGRSIAILASEFIALQDRLIAAARSARGLDLAGIRMASAANDRFRLSLGAWFLLVAGHQERHLDQAARTRKEIGA